MNYFVDLFSPETSKFFEKSDKSVTGFRDSKRVISYVDNQNIGPGDKFICYVTRVQRFIGVLEAIGQRYIDETPLFQEEDDPFTLRFKVKPIVWLPLEKAIPIREDFLWNNLSFTKERQRGNSDWAYMVFSSPRAWPKEDCELLEKELIKQSEKLHEYAFTENDEKNLKRTTVRVKKSLFSVQIPEDDSASVVGQEKREDYVRESIKIQAKLSEIGVKLGFNIWLPKNDRSAVLNVWNPNNNCELLGKLPFSFDETTMRTIMNIDVLWVKNRTIARAFEVEGTTSIYSGILRMADLFALLPNVDIKIHIVAHEERRNEVFKQISRPVFSVMEKGPLAKLCSYISYDSVYKLAKENRLEYMKDDIIESYEESYDDQNSDNTLIVIK